MAKVKIPKRVAGIKLPKTVRKRTKRALKSVDSPAARNLALAGLAMAAEHFIESSRAERTAKTAAREVVGQARAGRKQLRKAMKQGLDGIQLGDVLRTAAADAARRFLEGFEEGQRAVRAAAQSKDEGKKKKSNGRSSGRDAAEPAEAAHS